MELFIKSYGSYKPGNRNERVRCPGQGRSSCPGLRCVSTCLSLTMVWVLFLWNRHLSYGRIGWQWNSRPLKGQEATDRSRGSLGTLSGGITCYVHSQYGNLSFSDGHKNTPVETVLHEGIEKSKPNTSGRRSSQLRCRPFLRRSGRYKNSHRTVRSGSCRTRNTFFHPNRKCSACLP